MFWLVRLEEGKVREREEDDRSEFWTRWFYVDSDLQIWDNGGDNMGACEALMGHSKCWSPFEILVGMACWVLGGAVRERDLSFCTET